MTSTAAFGARLRSCRQSAGLSQEQLAERSGLSIRTISNLERGRTRCPHPHSVRRLADALELREQARREFFIVAGRPLSGASAPRGTTSSGDPALQAFSSRAVPRQLPAPVRPFAGRESELAALTRLLTDAGSDAQPTVVISAIKGMAGIGKTALAVRWAHQAVDRFPDGQLYVNLRGFDPTGRPMPPATVIRCFLDTLGVPAGRIPTSLDAQAGLYRSLLSGRRMLVLLDNARDADQVRPLLPGGPGCMVLVTSRSQLAGLVAAEGAHQQNLGLLTEAEAHELLARRLGAARLEAEPEAAAELAGLCDRLPLALAIAAARASAWPGLGLGALAEELKDAGQRLDVLETGDAAASVRAVFSWSLDGLSAPAARMFALLGLHPGPDITIPAAASLAGVLLPQARRALGQLAEAHLITEHAPGRFGLHDLLRAYAAEKASATCDQAARHAALARALDHYLHTAHAAALVLNPPRSPLTLTPPRRGVTAEQFSGHRQALAWFEAEHHVLISAVTLAVQAGFDACAWQLPWAVTDFLLRRGHWHECASIQRAALAAAIRLEDLAGQAAARQRIAWASVRLTDYDGAKAQLAACLHLHRRLGDQAGEARIQQALSSVSGYQGRHADALGHAERALAVFQAIGDLTGQAGALNDVGWSHAQLCDYQRARTFCQQALAMHRELGNPAGEAVAWDSLGYAEHQLGGLSEAAACYQRALGLFREVGARIFEAETLTRLGDTHRAASDEDKAQRAWQQALAILDDLHHSDAAQVRAKLRQAPRALSQAPVI